MADAAAKLTQEKIDAAQARQAAVDALNGQKAKLTAAQARLNESLRVSQIAPFLTSRAPRSALPIASQITARRWRGPAAAIPCVSPGMELSLLRSA